MTLAQAAALRGVNLRTLQAAALKGTLPARKFGDVWATTLPHVDAWLKNAKHRPGPLPKKGA